MASSTCPVLWTGQTRCYDTAGHEIQCPSSGQDAEFSAGLGWPEVRFEAQDEVVCDRFTGLMWTRDANRAEFPLTWTEALDYIASLNRGCAFGYCDWRLPNRRELRSLISHQTRKPALPPGHPFRNVFLGWYWSSTTAAISPTHAWCVHLEGARMFYGGKDQSYLVWPVRGESRVLPTTGQTRCFDAAGRTIDCRGSGQDGELRKGVAWPHPRFEADGDAVRDGLTGLRWQKKASLGQEPVSWDGAFALIERLNQTENAAWRLPTINELESLVDCAAHSPALPHEHPFGDVQTGYWSSTTSFFEPDWAWALYLDKGAVGVGQKAGRHFHVWPVLAG